MSKKREKSEVTARTSWIVHEQPMRELVARRMCERGMTAAALSEAIGFAKSTPIDLFLMGLTKLPIAKAEQLASALGLELELVVRVWIKECYPEVLDVLGRLYPTLGLCSGGDKVSPCAAATGVSAVPGSTASGEAQ